LITIVGFQSSAPKAENGFVRHKNCVVVAPRTKQFEANVNYFSYLNVWFNGPALDLLTDL
jgi:hypothetical protein